MTASSTSILFFVNGKRHDVILGSWDPTTTLLSYLRKNGLTGTKLGCGEGGCGACTVMVSKFDSSNNKIRHISANACLFPLYSLDGLAITTIEGIGGMREGLHPIQKRIADLHGSQCGFCTPGIVMAVYAQFRSNPNSTPAELEACLDGNLCRCTGYRPILDAAKSLSNQKDSGCCKGGGGSCPCKEESTSEIHQSTEKSIHSLPSLEEESKVLKLVEPIFPPALYNYVGQSLAFHNEDFGWFQPVLLQELLSLKEKYPEGKLVVGNTEVGIETKFKGLKYRIFMNPSHVTELNVLKFSESLSDFDEKEGLLIGAAVTLNDLKNYLGDVLQQLESREADHKGQAYAAIQKMLKWFASNHIRNVSSVAGNVATASPISDLNPLLLASGAVLKLSSSEGSRNVPISEFFLAYRKVNMKPNEILESIFIPTTKENEFIVPMKQARRREDDISIVTAGIKFSLVNQGEHDWIISSATLAFGGMAPISLIAANTSKWLEGQSWCSKTFSTAYEMLKRELQLPASVPGGQPQYRMTLAVSFLFKAFLMISTSIGYELGEKEASGGKSYMTEDKPESRGEQIFYSHADSLPNLHEELGVDYSKRTVVGQSVQHKSAKAQTSGNAKYVNDIPLPKEAVHAVPVLSTRAHARIVAVDISEAEKCEGFIRYFGAKDIIGSNKWGHIIEDEEIFVENEVKFFGATIGAVIAESHELAVAAAKKVRVQYEDLPAIITIDEAIEAKSFFEEEIYRLKEGDVEAQKANSDFHIEGTLYMGGQEHFYLETNCAVAVPMDNNTLEVFSSTQNCQEAQKYCAAVCGLSASQVNVRVKRVGGGFGGKESKPTLFACIAALAAFTLNRPTSILIERDVDMSITGQRHAFKFQYKAGCKRDGTFTYLETKLYNNGGFSLDLSGAVMGERSMFHLDNCYKWPAVVAEGYVCRTNQPSHTAYRGFGGPQAMFFAETIVQHFAEALKIPSEIIRERNFYNDFDRTYYGQNLEKLGLIPLWHELKTISSFQERKYAVDQFNSQNRWKKRGIALIPTKYGINFVAPFLNQGGALVHVYLDGSVLVAHGGNEIGQGLHTKMTQIAAECFGIPHELVMINETSTSTVANSTPTAASMSTDLYGMAVLNACHQIAERLKPIRARLGAGADWKSVVQAAYMDRVDLSAHGFHCVALDRCGYDWKKECADNAERGHPYNYFTLGVGCAEVEVDCLTGDHKVLRVDILMDVGKSINPALDIGQIEGAFTQGMGLFTMEELIWGDQNHRWIPQGQLFTRGPGTYKIPSFNDVPTDFRIHLADTNNKFAVHSSKAIGEPPLFLGAAVLFAIKAAIIDARKGNGIEDYYCLDSPATSERIRMACADSLVQLCMEDLDNEFDHFRALNV